MKFPIFILYIISSCVICSGQAPPFVSLQWASTKSISQKSYGYSISVDYNKNVFISGGFSGQYPPQDSMQMGGYLAKYDSTGNFQWGKKFFSQHKVVPCVNGVDQSGNVFVARGFTGNLKTENWTLNNMSGSFLCKYNSDGSLQFQKFIDHVWVEKILIDGESNVLVAGRCIKDSSIENHIMNKTGFIAKYTNDGNLLWIKDFYFPIGNNPAYDLKSDLSGNIFFCSTVSTVGDNEVAPGVFIQSAGGEDGFLAKFDSEVNLIWIKTISGEKFEIPTSLAVSENGEVYLTGICGGYDNTVSNFEDQILATTRKKIFVAKYNAQGNCLWVKSGGSNGSDHANGIIVNKSNQALLVGDFGYLGGNAFFDSFELLTTSHHQMNLFLTAYNSDGSVAWAEGSYPGSGIGRAITIDRSGSIYLTGDYANFTFAQTSLSGESQSFVFKLATPIVTGVEESHLREPNTLYTLNPNPVKDFFRINSKSSDYFSCSVTIANLLGAIVFEINEYLLNEPISVSNFENGIYIVRIYDGEFFETKKLLIQK
jgi:hypothetical protein